MPATARLALPEQRHSRRHPVNLPIIAECAQVGDVALTLVNMSPEGFMAIGATEIGRGERLVMRLPVIGRIEAHLVWHSDPRAGFRFERLIRLHDFTRLIVQIEAEPWYRTNDLSRLRTGLPQRTTECLI